MSVDDAHRSGKDFPTLAYFFSTLFVVFFSVNSIQKWPSIWGQSALVLACILPALAVLIKNRRNSIWKKGWSVESKFVLIIFVLGMLNICFSEDQFSSLKGMGLFLMSGILVFYVSCFVFNSKQAQKGFFYLCTFCFIVLLVYGTFEFLQQINFHGNRILLFSGNPIPAGSLLILLSVGPFVLLVKSKNNWQRLLWIFCLLLGAFLITLIAQRGPALAMIVMAFVLAASKRKGIWIFTLVALVLVGAGYQASEWAPEKFKQELLRKDTLLVRMEFYHIALEIFKEKPIFGLGFNSSLSRFIPYDYKAKTYPANSKDSFQSMVAGVHVFDNMALSFLGESGGFLAMAYVGLILYLMIVAFRSVKSTSYDKVQVLLILIVLAGFITHSMTFDSLKYPHLNWIFHSLLGLIACCKISDQKDKLTEDRDSI